MGFKKRTKASGYFWATRAEKSPYRDETIALWDGNGPEPSREGKKWVGSLGGGKLLVILTPGKTSDPTFTLLREIVETCNKVYRIKLEYSKVRRKRTNGLQS